MLQGSSRGNCTISSSWILGWLTNGLTLLINTSSLWRLWRLPRTRHGTLVFTRRVGNITTHYLRASLPRTSRSCKVTTRHCWSSCRRPLRHLFQVTVIVLLKFTRFRVMDKRYTPWDLPSWNKMHQWKMKPNLQCTFHRNIKENFTSKIKCKIVTVKETNQ